MTDQHTVSYTFPPGATLPFANIGLYDLAGHVPVPSDPVGWTIRPANERRVAWTEIGDATVSTVFLAVDHSFGDGPPLLFETMVFGGALDCEQVRYATWEEAEAGHAAMCERVRSSQEDDQWPK